MASAPTRPWTDPIGDLAYRLQYDVCIRFRFVADDIRYEPYPGILRGARTLCARRGHSVDKALLLGALLRDSQNPLPIRAWPLTLRPRPRSYSLSTDLDAARKLAKEPLARGLEQATAVGATVRPTDSARLAQIEQDTSAVQAHSAERLAAAKANLDGSVTMIEDALQGAGVVLPSDTASSLPPAETAAHTWVQMEKGTTWVDLDPTVAGCSRVPSWPHPRRRSPRYQDDLRSQIEFGVLVESMSGGTAHDEGGPHLRRLRGCARGDARDVRPRQSVRLPGAGPHAGDPARRGLRPDRPARSSGSQTLVADSNVAFPSGTGSDLFGAQASGAPAGPSRARRQPSGWRYG